VSITPPVDVVIFVVISVDLPSFSPRFCSSRLSDAPRRIRVRKSTPPLPPLPLPVPLPPVALTLKETTAAAAAAAATAAGGMENGLAKLYTNASNVTCHNDCEWVSAHTKIFRLARVAASISALCRNGVAYRRLIVRIACANSAEKTMNVPALA
jgi:hypothetical protein